MRVASGERDDRSGHVVGQDLPLEPGPPGVVLAELLLLDAVDRGTRRAPAIGDDAGAAADAAVALDAA